jgi:hypothetical protein
LGVFVTLAIEGVGDTQGFGGDRLEAAAEQHGLQAARQLLDYLKALPAKAEVQNAEEFVIGYIAAARTVAHKELTEWDGLLGEAFALMSVDVRQEPYEFGKRLMAVIRKASDFVSPRLNAWKLGQG